MKKGIAVAGNMIVDQLYPVERFANAGELTTIVRDMTRSTGGCLCNDIVKVSGGCADLRRFPYGAEPGGFCLNCAAYQWPDRNAGNSSYQLPRP